MSNLVTIRRYRDLPEAQLALSKLESAGINCQLLDDEMVRLHWLISNGIGGVRLQVAEDEVEDAKDVLADSEDASSAPEWAAVSEVHLFAASSNRGKLREFRKAADEYDVTIDPLPNLNEIEPPEETGATFEQNARIKAIAYSRDLTGQLVFADDSGLEVDALGGAPGVYSARYAATEDDPEPSDDDNNYRLIYELSQRPSAERTGRFVCVIALAKDGEVLQTFTGITEGEILQAPLGKGGFGYDPLFFLPALNKTFAELGETEKLDVSHRGKAFRAMLRWLRKRTVR